MRTLHDVNSGAGTETEAELEMDRRLSKEAKTAHDMQRDRVTGTGGQAVLPNRHASPDARYKRESFRTLSRQASRDNAEARQ